MLPGPMPGATLTCLSDLDIPVQFIHGNGDRVVLAQMAGKDISEVPEQFREVIRWTAQQLHPEHEALLASWPPTCRVEIRGLGEVLFCHATPRNDTECFTRPYFDRGGYRGRKSIGTETDGVLANHRYNPTVVAMVFAVHTVEAYRNFIGECLDPADWADERNYFRNEPYRGFEGKVKKVLELVGLPFRARRGTTEVDL